MEGLIEHNAITATEMMPNKTISFEEGDTVNKLKEEPSSHIQWPVASGPMTSGSGSLVPSSPQVSGERSQSPSPGKTPGHEGTQNSTNGTINNTTINTINNTTYNLSNTYNTTYNTTPNKRKQQNVSPDAMPSTEVHNRKSNFHPVKNITNGLESREQSQTSSPVKGQRQSVSPEKSFNKENNFLFSNKSSRLRQQIVTQFSMEDLAAEAADYISRKPCDRVKRAVHMAEWQD